MVFDRFSHGSGRSIKISRLILIAPPSLVVSLGFVTVACAHILLLWALLHAGPAMVKHVKPLMVALMIEVTQQAAPAPVPLPQPVRPALAPAPLLPVPAALPPLPLPDPTPIRSSAVPEVAPTRPAAAVPLPTQTVQVPVAAPTAAPALAAPAPRRQLPASAVRYLSPPPAEVPRASRRAGESGTVWLRVVVDADGRPAQVLLHRSSGFVRLDEQALWAMRQARFKPHSEDGHAVEVEVIAPIEYPAG